MSGFFNDQCIPVFGICGGHGKFDQKSFGLSSGDGDNIGLPANRQMIFTSDHFDFSQLLVRQDQGNASG